MRDVMPANPDGSPVDPEPRKVFHLIPEWRGLIPKWHAATGNGATVRWRVCTEGRIPGKFPGVWQVASRASAAGLN